MHHTRCGMACFVGVLVSRLWLRAEAKEAAADPQSEGPRPSSSIEPVSLRAGERLEPRTCRQRPLRWDLSKTGSKKSQRCASAPYLDRLPNHWSVCATGLRCGLRTQASVSSRALTCPFTCLNLQQTHRAATGLHLNVLSCQGHAQVFLENLIKI